MADSLSSKDVFNEKQKIIKKDIFIKTSNLTTLSDKDYDIYDTLIIKIMKDDKITKEDIIAFDKLKKDLKIRIIRADIIKVI